MTTLRINTNESTVTDITVRGSDRYSDLILVRVDRTLVPEDMHSSVEMFLTPTQLENIGHFLIRQAQELKAMQEYKTRTSK